MNHLSGEPFVLRAKLAANRRTILTSLDLDPNGVDAREPLWIERFRLLNELDALT